MSGFAQKGRFGHCAIFVQFSLAVRKQLAIIAPRNPPPSHFVSPGRNCPCLWHEWVLQRKKSIGAACQAKDLPARMFLPKPA